MKIMIDWCSQRRPLLCAGTTWNDVVELSCCAIGVALSSLASPDSLHQRDGQPLNRQRWRVRDRHLPDRDSALAGFGVYSEVSATSRFIELDSDTA